MQTVGSGWNNAIQSAHRRISHGVLFSWLRQTASGIKFFTINQSAIGGPDQIKGGGGFITFWDKYRFEDVGPDVLSWSVQRKLGQYPFGMIMAEADVELDNTSKRYLPNYDTTIGSGILPNRPMKITVGINDEYLKCFVGFTQMPELTLNQRVARFHAFDAMQYINNYKSTFSGVMTDAYFHTIVASGLQEMGFTTDQYVLDSSLQSRIGYLAPRGRKWGDIFREGVDAEQGLMFVDENGVIRFWNRQHFLTTSGTQTFSLGYSSAEDIQWQNTPIINDVIVKSKPRSVQANQRIWELDSALEILAGEDKELFIDFEDEFGALPVTSIDIPEYVASADSSFYATNLEFDGSGDAGNSYISVIEAYSFGETYKLVFRNTHTNSVFITALAIYATPAKVTTVIEERQEDDDSIEIFGRNPSNNGEPIEIENNLIQDEDTARTLAYTLVKEYKDPRKRYIVPVAVGSDPALQIGDYGTLTIQDTGEVKNVWIVGITMAELPNGDLSQILELEERQLKQYFQINVSSIGGAHAIAP